ncbi:MAG: ABC transporter substrate-binding protein [Rubrobacteraceae bacterium]
MYFAERRPYSRSDFLKLGGGALAGLGAMGLSGCGGSASGASSDSLSFLVWGGTAEEDGFRGAIGRYEEENPGVKIDLIVAPYDNYVKLNTLLAAGLAPDLVRCQYQLLGRYASAEAFVDLSEFLEPDYGDDFTPALWQAVGYEGRPYALPHHTDTMAVYYNADIFGSLGIEAPAGIEGSWTWDEFMRAAERVKESDEADYPFAVAWQGVPSSYRWMWFLFQNGGQLLNDDLTGARIDSPEGIETIEWHKSWFDEGFVPPSTSIKSTQLVETLFANGNIAMMLNGNWMIPFLEDSMSAAWDVTYMIREEEMASDLGGNAVAVTRDSKNPELAADFLKYLVSVEEMENFCVDAQFIPARASLVERGLDYSLRPEEMNLFVEQSTVVPEAMAAEQTVPESSQITQVLGNELELAFRAGQSARQTARNISVGIERIFEQGEEE